MIFPQTIALLPEMGTAFRVSSRDFWVQGIWLRVSSKGFLGPRDLALASSVFRLLVQDQAVNKIFVLVFVHQLLPVGSSSEFRDTLYRSVRGSRGPSKGKCVNPNWFLEGQESLPQFPLILRETLLTLQKAMLGVSWGLEEGLQRRQERQFCG